MLGTKLEFPGGGGEGQKKIFCWGEVWIFSGTAYIVGKIMVMQS